MAYRTLNPFTEQTVREFDNHSDDYVEKALSRADALYRSDWSRGDRAPRLAVLSKLSSLIIDNRDRIARTMAEEMGKPVVQGQMEADLCAAIAQYYADHADDMLKSIPVPSDVGEGWVEFHPRHPLVDQASILSRAEMI